MKYTKLVRHQAPAIAGRLTHITITEKEIGEISNYTEKVCEHDSPIDESSNCLFSDYQIFAFQFHVDS